MFVFRSGSFLLVVFIAINTTNKKLPSSFFLFARALKRKKRTQKRKNPTLLVRQRWMIRSWCYGGTRKNIYYLSHKGNTFVGREHKKSIKVNYYELAHQDMLIKWLVAQPDIEHYQTERELKMENGNLNAYHEIIIIKKYNSEIYVEFERTRKTPERFRKKLDGLRKYFKDNYQVHWITPTQTLANWIENQINTIGAYPSQHIYEIWNK